MNSEKQVTPLEVVVDKFIRWYFGQPEHLSDLERKVSDIMRDGMEKTLRNRDEEIKNVVRQFRDESKAHDCDNDCRYCELRRSRNHIVDSIIQAIK